MISIIPTTKSKTAISAIAALLLLFAAGQVRGEESAPYRMTRETTDRVIAVLEKKDLSADEKRRQIEDIVTGRFDFETLSRLTLAQNWKKLTSEQQTQFVQEFRRHLAITYGRNVESYNHEKVEITGERSDGHGDWTVKTRITRAGKPEILVDYRLRQKDGEWRIIDVVIEGVSLVSNFRSQFQDVVSRQGAAKLIDLLREKNERNEPFQQSAQPEAGNS